MVTPRVTEILPSWRTARPSRPALDIAKASQRDLVVASLLVGGLHGDVYRSQSRAAQGPVRPRGW